MPAQLSRGRRASNSPSPRDLPRALAGSDGSPAQEAEAAFRRHTGISIADYFVVSGSVLARLINRGRNEDGFPGIAPETFYSSVAETASWRPFFEISARSVEDMRSALRAEEAQYGTTTYGSLTFERTPLVRIDDVFYIPLSMYALQRKVTEGVFHILAEAAERDGLDRRYYTSAFGGVFQHSVEQTFRRGLAVASPNVEITADIEYGPRTARRRSSDVILAFDENPVFIEVVSGPLRAATSTRGDLSTLDADVERLVVHKTKQLDKSIMDFFEQRLVLKGADLATVRAAWPVIVTSHSLPHAPTLMEEIEKRVEAAGWLLDPRIATLSIISAEELFFCEGFMEQGRSFISLIRDWKAGPSAAGPLKNYLVELGGGRAPGSRHFELRFAEANASYVGRLLGKEISAEEILSRSQTGPDEGLR